MDTDFFTEISNTKPYLKAALEGFAGTGKTYTAGLIAIGLHKRVGSSKPVVIFDTERAAKFLKPMFTKAGIRVVLKESRSLSDLKETMRICREGFTDILIIDSISHVWENVLAAFLREKKRERMEFQDWGIVKPAWKTEFSEPFVNDPYHIVMCGRAGYEYETVKDAETQRRQIFKSGIKMKVEGETAYEPDLLILMERFEEVLGETKKVWREATVLKDRADVIDGKTFKDPTFKDFEPTVNVMLSEPDKVPLAAQGNDALLFHTEDEKAEHRREQTKWTEEIEGLLGSTYPSTGAADKKVKLDLLDFAFSSRSWTDISRRSAGELKVGYEKISKKLVADGVIQLKVLPPTQEQRDKLQSLLEKANIYGEERRNIEATFATIETRDTFAGELEKTEADLAMRSGKKEPSLAI
jgi:hypothetical protein